MPSVYEIITEKILQKLEQGTIPWRKPWNMYRAVNWKTQRPYRGINVLLLEPGEYATPKQIHEAGGRIKKGARGSIVVFWKWIKKPTGNIDPETGQEIVEEFPLLRYYRVYEINTQCEGLKSNSSNNEPYNNPIEKAEEIVASYTDKPEIRFAPNKAYYHPVLDYISIPELKDFQEPAEYYSTLYHELVHSTGHKKRLNRKSIAELSQFGSAEYSKEELIAEIGAAMLCAIAGLEQRTLDNSAAYIQGWLKALNNDKKMVVLAASQAQKAVDYINGQKFHDEN